MSTHLTAIFHLNLARQSLLKEMLEHVLSRLNTLPVTNKCFISGCWADSPSPSPLLSTPSPSLRFQVQVPRVNHVNVSTHHTSFRSLIAFQCQNEDSPKKLTSYRLVMHWTQRFNLQVCGVTTILLKFYDHSSTSIPSLHLSSPTESPIPQKSDSDLSLSPGLKSYNSDNSSIRIHHFSTL